MQIQVSLSPAEMTITPFRKKKNVVGKKKEKKKNISIYIHVDSLVKRIETVEGTIKPRPPWKGKQFISLH